MTDSRLRALERAWLERKDRESREAYAQALQRSGTDTLYFVYRSGYEGPSRKRVIELDCASVLEWFRQGCSWALEAGDEVSAHDQVVKWCGGHVYGLNSVFQSVSEQRLDLPETWTDLVALLDEHLYVEGCFAAREPVLSVITDDDEVTLAYFFVPQSYALLHPERTDYLLRPDWKLPDSAASLSAFADPPRIPLREIGPRGNKEGRTYLLSLYDEDSGFLHDLREFPAALLLPGVRVPDLATYLQEAVASEAWPQLLFALRAALGEDCDLSAATERCREWGVDRLAAVHDTGTYQEMRGRLAQRWADLSEREPRERPDLARGHASPHLLQFSYCHEFNNVGRKVFHHDQWLVFDDLWASEHPHLAESLIRFAAQWDPLGAWDEDPLHSP